MTTTSIPTVQTAAVLKGEYGKLHTIDKNWPVTQPGPGEALVQLEASGICSGDVNPRDGYPPAPKVARRPLVTGHEGVGHVIALGEGSTGVSIGDRVGMGWRRSTCHECRQCQSGSDNACQESTTNGYDGHGTNQQFMAVPISDLVPIPKSTMKASELAPLLCAGGTALGGVRSANVKYGDWICIVGAAGGVGGLAVRYAKHAGCHVVAIDSKTKQEHCESLGADCFVDYENAGTVVQRVKDATKGGPQGTVVCSAAPASYTQAIEYSSVGASIVSIGPAMVQFHTGHLMQKSLKFLAQSNGSRKDIEDALKYGNEGITPSVQVVSIEDIDISLDKLKRGQVTGRLVISFK